MSFYSVRSSALLALVVLCPLIPSAQAQFTQQGSKLVGTGGVGQAIQGTSVAVSADGNTAIVGGPEDNANTGAVWVFTRSGGVWTQQGDKLVGTGAVGHAEQGFSVAVSGDGNTAIVGGWADTLSALPTPRTGAAWVFTRSGGVWTQQGDKLVGTGAVLPTSQGYSVAVSEDGNTAIVGGPEDNGNTGAAWVFTRAGSVWTQQGDKLVGTGAVVYAGQGSSVAVSKDGDTAILGGWADNHNTGAVWVFTRSGGVWTQQGNKLVGKGRVGQATQGWSVAVSGDGNTAIAGGPSDNNGAGAAWVFVPSPWKRLKHTFPGNAGPCLVLTDGTVACNNSPYDTNQWYRLKPDNTGSYLNGSWTDITMRPMPYQPVSFASAVLPNGKLIVQGGEFLSPDLDHAVCTNQGAVYDPATNMWTTVTTSDNVIPYGVLGDSQSVIFPDGTFMIANKGSDQVAIFPPALQATFPLCAPYSCYSLARSTTKDDPNAEEGWTLLPNGDILVVDNQASPNTQTYSQGTGAWTSRGPTPCDLAYHHPPDHEVGPQVLRPDKTVVAFGAGIHSPHTGACIAIYNTVDRTWKLSQQDFPDGLDVADGPASLLLNGNVLVMASPGFNQIGARFFEWDGTNLNEVPGPPNAPSDTSGGGHMVILPSGEVMFTDYTQDVELYSTANATFQNDWRPVITGIPHLNTHATLPMGGTYKIDGFQFNGLSQGAAYGDDLQTATNYPLVRATQLFGARNTVYFKTHDHSTMAVATGGPPDGLPVYTSFDIPPATPPGLYSLVVVANGIPSLPRTVHVACSGQSASGSSALCH